MPTTIERQPLQEVQPAHGYKTIEAHIAVLEQQAEPIIARMMHCYNTAPADTRLALDELNESFRAAQEEAENNGETPPALSSFFTTVEGKIPKNFIEDIITFKALESELMSADAELEKYAPEKAREIARKTEELEESLDYYKVVAEAFSDQQQIDTNGAPPELLVDISRIVALRKLLTEQSEVPQFFQLEVLEQLISKHEAEWQERGLFKDTTERERVEESSAPSLSEQLTAIEAHLNDVYEIHKKYGSFRRREASKSSRSLRNLIKRMEETQEDPPSIDDILQLRQFRLYNEPLSSLVGARVMSEAAKLSANNFEMDTDTEAYKELVEQARSIDTNEALGNIEIAGSFDNLPFEYSEAELRFFLLRYIPPLALKTVKRIEFCPITDEDHAGHGGSAGLHIRYSRYSVIVISNEDPVETYEFYREKHDDQTAAWAAKLNMEGTIAHEFAHALIGELPVAALGLWDESVADDGIYVTPYVERHFNKNHPNRYQEDFAESMYLYVTNPKLLHDLSPDRFERIRHILMEFKYQSPSDPADWWGKLSPGNST